MAATIHLVVESGPGKGMTISIPPAGALLGRADEADIPIRSDKLSRHHARFYFKGGALRITDLNSANETIVNGATVKDAALTAGDLIQVGDTLLRVLGSVSTRELQTARGRSAGSSSAPRRTGQAIKNFILQVLALPFWLALIAWWLFLAYSLMAPPVKPAAAATPPATSEGARP